MHRASGGRVRKGKRSNPDQHWAGVTLFQKRRSEEGSGQKRAAVTKKTYDIHLHVPELGSQDIIDGHEVRVALLAKPRAVSIHDFQNIDHMLGPDPTLSVASAHVGACNTDHER